MANSDNAVEHALKDLQDRVKLLQSNVLPLVNVFISFITLVLVVIILIA